MFVILLTQIVLYHRKDILEGDCEFSTIHSFLAKAPTTHGVDIESLIITADNAFQKVPPSALLSFLEDPIVRAKLLKKRYKN